MTIYICVCVILILVTEALQFYFRNVKNTSCSDIIQDIIGRIYWIDTFKTLIPYKDFIDKYATKNLKNKNKNLFSQTKDTSVFYF